MINEMTNENYFVSISNFKDLQINIKCLNPSNYLLERLNSVESSLLFSATLTPKNYYENLICENKNDDFLNVPTCFDKNRLKILVSNNISTKYNDRIKTVDRIIKYVNSFVLQKKGNYILYCPSFEYLQLIKNCIFNEKINVFYQDLNMNIFEKNNFFEPFQSNQLFNLAVCVIGGSFSESINFTNNSLNGVIVVGVGMPSICFENNLIKEFYNKKNLDGFKYAYIDPGINKILQAVGRIIRNEKDSGVALLIDDRYFNNSYSYLFKEKFSNYIKINNEEQLIYNINYFYKSLD